MGFIRSKAGHSVLVFLFTLMFVLTLAVGCKSQEANPTPELCLANLGLEITHELRDLALPRDTQAIALGEEIQHLFAGPFHRGATKALVDSLATTHGDSLIRGALLMMISGQAKVNPEVRVGVFYAAFEGDLRYLEAILVSSWRPTRERLWALRAIEVGAMMGIYRDSTAAQTAGTVVCDMAFLIRPFVRDVSGSVEGELPVTPFDSAGERQYSLIEAWRTFDVALITLADPELPGGPDILSRYSAWEPQPVLSGKASRTLRTYSRRVPGNR